MTSKPTYKLTYFNIKGRAEVARYLFAIAGVDYEDCRIERVDWHKFKEGTPFGQVPTLEVDGKVICQSHTIERYLAKQFGMAGKNNWDQARADMVVDAVEDSVRGIAAIRAEEDQTKKKELVSKYLESSSKIYHSLESILVENNGGDGYFVGDEITYADLVVSHYPLIIPIFTGGNDLDWTNYPKLSALRNRVETHPKVAEWIVKRPKTDM